MYLLFINYIRNPTFGLNGMVVCYKTTLYMFILRPLPRALVLFGMQTIPSKTRHYQSFLLKYYLQSTYVFPYRHIVSHYRRRH